MHNTIKYENDVLMMMYFVKTSRFKVKLTIRVLFEN